MKEHMVGVISDTHDNRTGIREAVSAFNRAGCALVVHAGDFIAPFTVREFEKLEGRFIGVFGNNDGERRGLAEQFAKIGSLHEPPHEFVHLGRRFALMHAPSALDRFLAREDVDVIVYGHSHKVDMRPGKPLVINPGECCSWLTGRSTIVILDLNTMHADVIGLDV